MAARNQNKEQYLQLTQRSRKLPESLVPLAELTNKISVGSSVIVGGLAYRRGVNSH